MALVLLGLRAAWYYTYINANLYRITCSAFYVYARATHSIHASMTFQSGCSRYIGIRGIYFSGLK